MLKISPELEIDEKAIFSKLMRRKTLVARFSFPYTPEQVLTMLVAACRAEVAARHRPFKLTEPFLAHLKDIARWLADTKKSTFGIFLCGDQGNGKTTVVKAIKSLYMFLHSDERYVSVDESPAPFFFGFEIVSAKELVRLAKAYANRNRDNADDVARYRRLMAVEVLCVDDLGCEPMESLSYGDFVNAAIDMVNCRYDSQLCTIATSNLAPAEIKDYYDKRFSDRFREMMFIVNFSHEPSFREERS